MRYSLSVFELCCWPYLTITIYKDIFAFITKKEKQMSVSTDSHQLSLKSAGMRTYDICQLPAPIVQTKQPLNLFPPLETPTVCKALIRTPPSSFLRKASPVYFHF